MSADNRNELLNTNVQYFIDKYGITSNNPVIDGILKMITHWCGIEQQLDTVPQQSIGIFSMMTIMDCRNKDFIQYVENL